MKKSLMFFLVLLCVLPLFAVRRTRVDTSGNTTYKIIWNDAYNGGPDNTNWAQSFKLTGWTGRVSYYFCNDGTCYSIMLFTDDNAGFYDYKYHIIVKKWVDRLWEDLEFTNYYDFQYNQALANFKIWENVAELGVR